MADIFTTLKRIRRLSLPHRIAYLRSLIALELPQSMRRAELEAALRHEMLSQLRKEIRGAA